MKIKCQQKIIIDENVTYFVPLHLSLSSVISRTYKRITETNRQFDYLVSANLHFLNTFTVPGGH